MPSRKRRNSHDVMLLAVAIVGLGWSVVLVWYIYRSVSMDAMAITKVSLTASLAKYSSSHQTPLQKQELLPNDYMTTSSAISKSDLTGQGTYSSHHTGVLEHSPSVENSVQEFEPISKKMFKAGNDVQHPKLSKSNYILNKYLWDAAPIIIEEHKLAFFTIPKVGCTVFKKLFRRMMGIPSWKTKNHPYDPHTNGLKYLYHYPIHRAEEIMTSPEWRRAVFVREPTSRVLSGFLDKSLTKSKRSGTSYVTNNCCRFLKNDAQKLRCTEKSQTFAGFLDVIEHTCPNNPHWLPQSKRIDRKWWPYINFVGYMDTIAKDTEILLRSLGEGVWETHGASGWDYDALQDEITPDGTENKGAVFQTQQSSHSTLSANHWKTHYTKELEQRVKEMMTDDYHSPYFHF
mmetsp:Transcript_2035/g.2185  ORF Transcript_2035/g.2185 Transcript_2035/m.2185 type:complete len:401 (+) Transcript_2035:154-1356(+)